MGRWICSRLRYICNVHTPLLTVCKSTNDLPSTFKISMQFVHGLLSNEPLLIAGKNSTATIMAEYVAISEPAKILTIAAAGLLLYVFCGVTYRLYRNPLAKFSGRNLVALTLWYEFYHDYFRRGRYTWEIADMHEKYGMVQKTALDIEELIPISVGRSHCPHQPTRAAYQRSRVLRLSLRDNIETRKEPLDHKAIRQPALDNGNGLPRPPQAALDGDRPFLVFPQGLFS